MPPNSMENQVDNPTKQLLGKYQITKQKIAETFHTPKIETET